jgi:hypothetical protein
MCVCFCQPECWFLVFSVASECCSLIHPVNRLQFHMSSQSSWQIPAPAIHTRTHARTHAHTHTHTHTHTHWPNTLWPNTAPCQNYSTGRLNMEHTPTLPQRYNTQTRPSTCGAQNSLCVCIDLFHCGPLSLCVHVLVCMHPHACAYPWGHMSQSRTESQGLLLVG